jgi:hypothetical protein
VPPAAPPVAVARAWRTLDVSTPEPRPFDPAAVVGLPVPVARWLRRAIEPGTPLRTRARLAMHGRIRVGRWLPFTARQVLAPDGFVWAATAGRPPLWISGFDRYTDGAGEMRWRLLGLVSVLSATGPDVTRSAAGRLAGETMLLPTVAAGLPWRAVDERCAVAAVVTGPFTHDVTVEVDDTGLLRAVRLVRWGNPGGGIYREHPFGVELDGARTVEGVTSPVSLRAGWWPRTDRWAEGEFFRAAIDTVELR